MNEKELMIEMMVYDASQKESFGSSCFIHRVGDFRKHCRSKMKISRKSFDEAFTKLLSVGNTRFQRLSVHGRPVMNQKELKESLKTTNTGNVYGNKYWYLWSLEDK